MAAFDRCGGEAVSLTRRKRRRDSARLETQEANGVDQALHVAN